MEDMFRARGPCLHAANTPQPPTALPPQPAPPPALYDLPCDSAEREEVQPAAELRHVQTVSLRAASAITAPTALSPPSPHPIPLRINLPCDSTGRGGVQPVAELRPFKHRKHGQHVQGACPRPDLQPSPSLLEFRSSRALPRTSSRSQALPCMLIEPRSPTAPSFRSKHRTLCDAAGYERLVRCKQGADQLRVGGQTRVRRSYILACMPVAAAVGTAVAAAFAAAALTVAAATVA
eukprot:scaffold54787_cov36-Phaeocystis_antarctica.AAC.1